MFCPKSKLYDILTLCSALLALAYPATAANYVTLTDNGPSSNRVDIVFLGDGYTQADLDAGTYDQHIADYLGHMFGDTPNGIADPFPRYAGYFNVHKVDVVSNESGADDPGLNHYVDTALDASYYWDGVTERLLYINSGKAQSALNDGLSGAGFLADIKLVTINETKYGGAGGSFATFAGGNPNAQEVALHELGHSFAGLADEYGGGGTYTGGEPFEINVTTDPTGSKWSHWIGYTDPRDSALDIGVYEGGRYHNQGIYRPSQDSKMRNLNKAFNAVAREQLILDIYDSVDPLDGWLDNTATAVGNEALWVREIDPALIAVEWYVNGTLVENAIGNSIDLDDLGYAPGTYAVTAHAYDRILDHAGSGDPLDLVRKDLDKLQQDITWTTQVNLAGDTNNDGFIDVLDLDRMGANFLQNGTWSEGDFTGDGFIDALDLNLLGENYGTVIDYGGGGQTIFAPEVPEPASLALALGFGPWLARRRR